MRGGDYTPQPRGSCLWTFVFAAVAWVAVFIIVFALVVFLR